MLLPNRIANIHKKKKIYKITPKFKVKSKTIEILNAIAVIIISGVQHKCILVFIILDIK